MPTFTMPHAITVPTLGAPTCGGVALTTADLSDFAHESDAGLDDDYERNLARCIRARRDGFVLCLRPTADRPAVVDMGQHAAADALLSAEAPRFIVVDPYTEAGDDLRDAPVMGVGVAA
jgi:hypothetical protein